MVDVERVGSVFSWWAGSSVRCRLWEGEERYLLKVLRELLSLAVLGMQLGLCPSV